MGNLHTEVMFTHSLVHQRKGNVAWNPNQCRNFVVCVGQHK